MKLSIPMMVKNESKYLAQVLEALQPIMEAIDSELIIVDTGSEDNTVEIAKKYTDKVYFHPWNNNFSEMRNITLSYATGDWILMVDGDEVLEKPQSIIDFLLSSNLETFNTGLVSIKNIMDENDLTNTSIFLSPRIFKNRKDFRFEGAIHNQPNHKPPYFEIHSTLVHYGYLSTDKELMERKFKRTGEILKAELEKDPENIYYWYQLSVTYGMHLDHDLAVEPAEKAYKLVKEKRNDLKPYMYVFLQLIKAYLNNKEYYKAEKICDEALKITDGYIDLHFFAGKLKYIRNNHEEALEQYKIYLELLHNYNNSVGKKDISIIHYTLEKYEEVYHDLVIIYEKQEEYLKALEYIEKIKIKAQKIKLTKNIINVYVNLSKLESLKSFYETEILKEDKKIIEVFEMSIENIKSKLNKEEKMELEEVFSETISEYSVLNKIKLEERKERKEISSELLDEIVSLDFSKLSVFYGDIIYYLLKRSYSVSTVLYNVRATKLRIYLDYFVKAFPDYHSVILGYIRTNNTENLKEARINKELEKYALVLDKLEEDDFKYMLERYLGDGIKYITNLYHPNIIEEEMLHDIKEDEEVFLMYLYKGRILKEKSPAEYIRYLKKAIQVFPFKKGIEVLKEELEGQLNPVNNEMENLKKHFKDNIKMLIENEMIQEAEELIVQYEQMSSGDLDILLFKSQISLLKSEGKDNMGVIN